MSYDEKLAARIARRLDGSDGVASKKMFGGIAWMLRGNMAVGIVKEDLMVRVGPERHEALVKEPHAREMDFTGRPMKGYLYVGARGCSKDADLARWIGLALEFAGTLPAKKVKSRERG